MEELPAEPAHVVLVRRLNALGIPDQTLRSSAGQDAFHRIRRGAYLPRDAWTDAGRDERYRARIVAVVGTRRSSVVLSHHSAALIHGLPVADGWPTQVHVTEPPETARRSKNGVIVHRRAVDGVEELDGMLMTDIARTVVDIAADGAFVDAVCVADAALRRGISRDELRGALESRPGPGRSRATRVIEFADPLAETSLESWSRAVIDELGFPRPVLQYEIATVGGIRRLDFMWPDVDAGAEADGLWKYGAIAEAQGMTGHEAFRREKAREADVRMHLRAFTRWGADDVRDRERLRHLLLSLGLRRLPSYRPRHPLR